MYKYKFLVAITAALVVSGCAQLEVSPGKHQNLNYAPINEASRSGIVSYSKDAIYKDGERAKAYETMAKSCNGPYKIIKEEIKRGNMDMVTEGVAILNLNRVYIHFKCVN